MTDARAPLALAKLHGAENTFVVLDERARPSLAPASDHAALARELCAPDGPMEGADGLLVLADAPPATVEMRVFNADGSVAEMCGNGVRCVARFLVDRGAPEHLTIATLAGPIVADVVAREPFAVRIDLGEVRFPDGALEPIFEALGAEWPYVAVDVGNPHAVMFVDDESAIDLDALGAAVQRDPAFPNGVNVHVARVAGEHRLAVRHYERGVGPTRACGTGAVACAAAAVVRRGLVSPVTVDVPGGALVVAWQPGAHALLTGPAEPMFERVVRS